ncbi:2-amino-4-hydroxy-6-hydroxymethyldihydropteridine diphosphokinase [Variovorax dokdonensis]|uniref:2-amino-4-hydroxy-6-hydroxymethyldihydropteridine pyrophosphokinase n=1 Tax=Variovorax dokdonensis TaxID=344883 RepID=A0ABT7N6W2_9BURK|nr:2-amino-4-hydroxy-6-hydroxymethyldihydropteridine diphosphokinase [Variovorax dokdonensis]MDM0043652.1 2-amino-4-hydroxy-6-hydroxymethyldihydropteridine diphosphokinase [Variovorax dokdonensis]
MTGSGTGPATRAAFVAIGANLGDACRAVEDAIAALDNITASSVAARSSLYRSAPVDAKGPDFINAVVELKTALEPLALLEQLQAIEQRAGRERPYRNAPRTLDLDLLDMEGVALDTQRLTLPHPRMNQRAFVLLPLAEIAPERVSADQLQAVAGQQIERL